MNDLNSITFYKAQFDIIRKQPDTDLLWQIILGIRTWITGKKNHFGEQVICEDFRSTWTPFKVGKKIFASDGSVFCESFSFTEESTGYISWACQVVEKPEQKSGYARREWTTEIGYQQISTDSAKISYIVKYNEIPGFWGPCEDTPSLTLPNLIKWLLSNQRIYCMIGKYQLVNHPIKLDPGDYPDFDKLIFDPERNVPIIYLSPYEFDEESQIGKPLINPWAMHNAIAGNAIVYYSDTLDFSDEMRYCGRDGYLCYNGSIRVYMPRANSANADDKYRHRFFTIQNIADLVQSAYPDVNIEDLDVLDSKTEITIIKLFRRVLAQEVNYYDHLFRLDDCKKLYNENLLIIRVKDIRERAEAQIQKVNTQVAGEAERSQALMAENSSLRETANEFQELFNVEDAELQQLKKDFQTVSQRLEDVASENYKLNGQVQSSRALFMKNRELLASLEGIRSIDEYPSTPVTIARFFETVYSERIVFTERARASLESCTTRPDILWRAFYDIVTKLFDLFVGSSNLSEVCSEFEQSTEWKCATSEGKQTRKDKKLMHEYDDEYNGVAISIEPHVGKGTRESQPGFFRIHFAHDVSIAPQIIIGHCGEHLENYTSQKIR